MKWEKTVDTNIEPSGSPYGLYEGGRLIGSVVRRNELWIADACGLLLGNYRSKRIAMAAVESALEGV